MGSRYLVGVSTEGLVFLIEVYNGHTTEQMGVTGPKFCSVTGSPVSLWMNGQRVLTCRPQQSSMSLSDSPLLISCLLEGSS